MEIDNSSGPLEKINKYIPKSGEWIEINELQRESMILMLMDLPSFIDTKEYTLTGMILFERLGERFQEPLKEIKFSVHDLNDNSYFVKPRDITQGVDQAFLSALATCSVTPIQIKIPEGIFRTLAGLLQLDCFFTKIDVVGNAEVLIFDGATQNLEGTMVKILNNSDVLLMTK